jgi:hypothetical protein
MSLSTRSASCAFVIANEGVLVVAAAAVIESLSEGWDARRGMRGGEEGGMTKRQTRQGKDSKEERRRTQDGTQRGMRKNE